ncbi:TonB [Arcticibacter svalbardensis MN12-7]|uniref:TonB n=1 Tax=Arcticibacter svalbardensis MN12-7 TaxID=1150600 RepID=R9GWN9_9SPHI|nr:TonB [Arcticibacter svalbardensis MN12-7]
MACHAQNEKITYYINKKGQEVKHLDSAAFIRVIQVPDSGSANFSLYEYYPDKTKKTVGYVSQYQPKLIYQGELVSYYKNGKTNEIFNYVNGKLKGNSFEYYENGQLKQSGTYDEGANSKVPGSLTQVSFFKLIDYFDSTGVQMIKSGDGYLKQYNAKNFGDEGYYKNGLKNAEWKGRCSSGSYTENYAQGVFTEGVALWADGSEHKYDKVEAMPEYRGGMRSFYAYVGKNYVYPPLARKAGVQGRLLLSFVVQKDGSLTDIVLLKDIGLGTGEEALRLLRESPDWQPGLQHGMPVRVAYVLPIMLNLGR